MAKFFCCFPLKFGVWLFTILFFAWGSALTVLGWYGVAKYNATTNPLALTRRQEVALIITTVSWTFLPLATLYGFGAILGRSYRFISFYSSLLAFQLGASIGAGVYFIYTLYRRRDNGGFVNACETRADVSLDKCQDAFDVLRGVIVAVYIFIWLIQIWGVVTISQFASERKGLYMNPLFSNASQPLPTLPMFANPVMMPPPAPPMLHPAPPGRFGPNSADRTPPSSNPPPSFTSTSGGVSLPPPVPVEGGPGVQSMYAFTAPGNAHGTGTQMA